MISAIAVPASYQQFNLEGAYYDLGADLIVENFPIGSDYITDSINNITEIESATVVRTASLSDVSGDYAITHKIMGINTTTYANTAFHRSDFADEPLSELLAYLTDQTSVLAQVDELIVSGNEIG